MRLLSIQSIWNLPTGLCICLIASTLFAPLPSSLYRLPRSLQQQIELSPQSSNVESIKGIIIGDTRADAPNLGPSAHWPTLKHAFLSHHPDLLLHLGDWVKKDAPQEWERVMKTLPSLPIVSVRGNHDRGASFFKLGFTQSDRVLSRLQLGPLLIYRFDTEGASKWTQIQLQKDLQSWIDSPLEGLVDPTQIKYRLWLQHRPIYSSGHHGSDERGWNQWLIPLIERLKVDVVLAGHDHHYERFCPQHSSTPTSCNVRGPQYVVSGGGATVTTPWASWLSTDRFPSKEGSTQRQLINKRIIQEKKNIPKMHSFRGRVKASSALHYLLLEVDQTKCLFTVYAVHFKGKQRKIDSFPCRF